VQHEPEPSAKPRHLRHNHQGSSFVARESPSRERVIALCRRSCQMRLTRPVEYRRAYGLPSKMFFMIKDEVQKLTHVADLK